MVKKNVNCHCSLQHENQKYKQHVLYQIKVHNNSPEWVTYSNRRLIKTLKESTENKIQFLKNIY